MNEQRIAFELARMARNLVAVDIDKEISKIDRMTDGNDHNGAVKHLFSVILKDRKGASAVEALENLQRYFGDMPQGLMDVQKELRNNGLTQAKRKFDEETYKRIYMAF